MIRGTEPCSICGGSGYIDTTEVIPDPPPSVPEPSVANLSQPTNDNYLFNASHPQLDVDRSPRLNAADEIILDNLSRSTMPHSQKDAFEFIEEQRERARIGLEIETFDRWWQNNLLREHDRERHLEED